MMHRVTFPGCTESTISDTYSEAVKNIVMDIRAYFVVV